MKSVFGIALIAAIAQAQANRNHKTQLDQAIVNSPTSGNDNTAGRLETRTSQTSASSTVDSVAEREADKNAARGQVQSDRRSTNEPDRDFVAAAQLTGGMGLGFVTSDDSYFAARGINKSMIQWKAPTAATGTA